MGWFSISTIHRITTPTKVPIPAQGCASHFSSLEHNHGWLKVNIYIYNIQCRYIIIHTYKHIWFCLMIGYPELGSFSSCFPEQQKRTRATPEARYSPVVSSMAPWHSSRSFFSARTPPLKGPIMGAPSSAWAPVMVSGPVFCVHRGNEKKLD